MNTSKSLLFAVALTVLALVVSTWLMGCDGGRAMESVESLIAHPERLRELRAQCKADHAKLGDAQCNAVAEATRRRFMGQGTPYTPKLDAPAAHPSAGASAAEAKPAP